MKVILHLNPGSDGVLALRAARYIIAEPDKKDAILQYGGESGTVIYARRNKASVTAYEQGAA